MSKWLSVQLRFQTLCGLGGSMNQTLLSKNEILVVQDGRQNKSHLPISYSMRKEKTSGQN